MIGLHIVSRHDQIVNTHLALSLTDLQYSRFSPSLSIFLYVHKVILKSAIYPAFPQPGPSVYFYCVLHQKKPLTSGTGVYLVLNRVHSST